MMKIACKQYLLGGFSLLSIGVLVLPVSALAMTVEEREAQRAQRTENRQEKMTEMQAKRDERMAERKENRQEAFCSRFVESARKISATMAERRSQFDERKGNHADILETKRNEREAKFEENRSQADERRNAMYEKLSGRAKTDEQKEAVEDFQKAVEAAVDTRRDVVDAAIVEFRKGVDAAVAGRKDDMQDAVATFKSAVEVTFDKAQKACESGTDQATIRADFKSGLEAARTALQSDRKESEKVGAQVKGLAETRRTAVKQALADFKATVATARLELKNAFGETGETETPTATP